MQGGGEYIFVHGGGEKTYLQGIMEPKPDIPIGAEPGQVCPEAAALLLALNGGQVSSECLARLLREGQNRSWSLCLEGNEKAAGRGADSLC